nr:barstar family protein [uncultured Sphingomonas sp.]
MQTQIVIIPTDRIVDWESFHDVFDEALGFPGYYGRNMNAWIDCLSYADDAESGMLANPVAPGDLLTLALVNAAEFKRRCPEQFDALIDCAAFVNYRRREVGDDPVLALLIDGYFA